MKILALNWRDLKNPLAGGAEVHLEAILSYLGKNGHSVTLICSRFKGSAKEEEGDCFRIIRCGGEFYFNLALPSVLRTELKKENYDVILDDINKVPFFTPLFTKIPVIAVIPHLMGNAVFKEVSFPIASYVWLSEKAVKPVYKKSWFEVISQSTKDDLVGRGYEPKKIKVIECGLDHEKYSCDVDSEKFINPTLVYVGRIKRYKYPDHILQSLALLKPKFPGIHLYVVGSGEWLAELKKEAMRLGLESNVSFTGFVGHAEKIRLMQQSWLSVNPSFREGWGLTNIEANACGTPCVAADSPGLRDSVQDGETGFLYPFGDIPKMTEKISSLLEDQSKYRRFRENAIKWAKTFTWERTGAQSLDFMGEVLDTYRA